MAKCIMCGKDTTGNKRGYKNFCGETCYSRYYRINRYGLKKCKYCGRQFVSETSKNKEYCSIHHYWMDFRRTEITYEEEYSGCRT